MGNVASRCSADEALIVLRATDIALVKNGMDQTRMLFCVSADDLPGFIRRTIVAHQYFQFCIDLLPDDAGQAIGDISAVVEGHDADGYFRSIFTHACRFFEANPELIA